MIDEKSWRNEFAKHIEHLREELSLLRTGRANPALVENILVEAYGTTTPIKQLASLSIPDARTIVISPWDSSVTKEIEKAITLSHIGAQPVNEGNAIRIFLPPLTEENRKNLVKILKEKTEKARIVMRGARDRAKEHILSVHKKKELGDDEKFQLLKKLDEVTREYINTADSLSAGKEKDIMSLS